MVFIAVMIVCLYDTDTHSPQSGSELYCVRSQRKTQSLLQRAFSLKRQGKLTIIVEEYASKIFRVILDRSCYFYHFFLSKLRISQLLLFLLSSGDAARVHDCCLNVFSFHPQITPRLRTCIASFSTKQTFMVEL